MAPPFNILRKGSGFDLGTLLSVRTGGTASFLGAVFFFLGSVFPWAAVAATDSGFASTIQPLLETKCGGCHGKAVRKANLDLHDAVGIRQGGESGRVVVPGKPDESLLYQMVHEKEMPPKQKNTPLTDAEVQAIREWIETGAAFDDGATSAKPEVTQHDVIPILLLRCTVCHGTQRREGGLDLRTSTSMRKGGKSGPAFVPGNPSQSLMLKRIQAEEMPPRKSLVEVMVKPMEPEEVRTLTRWIELGAPEVGADSSTPSLLGEATSKEDRAFWAFQTPHVPPLPKPTHRELVINPVDAFVLQQLEAKGLSLSPSADRLTLIRRASFDLTGLPPEPTDIEAFLVDFHPDAYERLIDRLLASPRYGERWGRHWLDVAGYADCEGRREQHLPRPFAWRYRDYVIRAFNTDKPYDQFLLEQLAGDELTDYEHAPEITQEIEDQLVATALLRMSPDPTWANLTGFVPDRLDVIADAVDVVGSGLMGLTFKCARCHSHKFDPIPHRDYYRLTAIFKGAYDEHDWLKPELNGFGGAVSAGLGERYLPYVTTAERKQWAERSAQFQSEMASLKALPQDTNTARRIKELEANRPVEPRLMALWDRGDPSPTYVYRRGNYLTPGTLVEPGLPSVLIQENESFQPKPPWLGAKSTGRRLAFARWLVQPNHPLTARVMINRIWKHHFGRGIVASVGNFGVMGDRPSHPELLDWLACEFVHQRWSIKAMHRLIMTSNTYRQSSEVTPTLQAVDPSNQLWSRMPMRRLSAEELRETLLWVAGQLDETRFGPPEAVTVRPDGLVLAGKRRSVYVQQLRKQPPSLLESFDLPAMNPNCLQRAESLVAPQALHLLNDRGIRELARQCAERVRQGAGADPTRQVQWLYRIALSRAPSATEQELCLTALDDLTRAFAEESVAAAATSHLENASKALTVLCHSVMNSAAFLYID